MRLQKWKMLLWTRIAKNNGENERKHSTKQEVLLYVYRPRVPEKNVHKKILLIDYFPLRLNNRRKSR